MFEKDAEEYGNSFEWTNDDRIIDYSKRGFQKGAEFGYNEGFKACAKSRLNVTTISDYPIKDDWHYVKDGDLPTEITEKEYLVALKSEYSGFHYEIDIWCKSLHCFASNNPKKVYAWKEIIIPELKESE